MEWYEDCPDDNSSTFQLGFIYDGANTICYASKTDSGCSDGATLNDETKCLKHYEKTSGGKKKNCKWKQAPESGAHYCDVGDECVLSLTEPSDYVRMDTGAGTLYKMIKNSNLHKCLEDWIENNGDLGYSASTGTGDDGSGYYEIDWTDASNTQAICDNIYVLFTDANSNSSIKIGVLEQFRYGPKKPSDSKKTKFYWYTKNTFTFNSNSIFQPSHSSPIPLNNYTWIDYSSSSMVLLQVPTSSSQPFEESLKGFDLLKYPYFNGNIKTHHGSYVVSARSDFLGLGDTMNITIDTGGHEAVVIAANAKWE